MKSKMLLISGLLSLTAGCATTATTTTPRLNTGTQWLPLPGSPSYTMKL